MHLLGDLVVLVRDYDEAVQFYRDKLGFEKPSDSLEEPFRLVRLRQPDAPHSNLRLHKAQSEDHLSLLGIQSKGDPLGLFLTDNLAREIRALEAKGVKITSTSQLDQESPLAHFEDLYGNEYLIIQFVPIKQQQYRTRTADTSSS